MDTRSGTVAVRPPKQKEYLWVVMGGSPVATVTRARSWNEGSEVVRYDLKRYWGINQQAAVWPKKFCKNGGRDCGAALRFIDLTSINLNERYHDAF